MRKSPISVHGLFNKRSSETSVPSSTERGDVLLSETLVTATATVARISSCKRRGVDGGDDEGDGRGDDNNDGGGDDACDDACDDDDDDGVDGGDGDLSLIHI